MRTRSVIQGGRIESSILFLRGQKVILDSALARLYGVETRELVQAVRRNRSRFPADFILQLTRAECDDLRSQSVISSAWGGRRYPRFRIAFEVIRHLMEKPETGRQRIGFRTVEK
ncbi:MAG: ORF6N domain-containing protein [Planctomycetes bacterium]|nr:ORF6N domain-containing protein [Planctomycetota bacterium]